MSGICGIINFSKATLDAANLRKMAEAANHRGPDGIHYWIQEDAGMANLCLNITPESLTETQPLTGTEGEIVLTADARIDNRSELIRIFASEGFLLSRKPAEASDAELIAWAYRCWGPDCSKHLLGDFAFAIWDKRKKCLFAARDPMGMRPLYYRKNSGRFLFASEIKQILAVPGVSPAIYEPAVGTHLTGLFAPLDWSTYSGISQLPPAHSLVVDENEFRIRRYWDIDPFSRIEYRDDSQYVEHFLEIFKEAVRCRLRTYKPIGILLSGGLDSGSIASMAGWLLENEENSASPAVHAFCWAFHDLPQCDERHISSIIVNHFGFPETIVSADEHWPLKDYPQHGPDRDGPFIGSFQALLETSMDHARTNGVGVMMSGDRGDLSMGGAIWDYWELFRPGRIGKLSAAIRVYAEQTGLSTQSFFRRYLLRPLIARIWPPGYADTLRWSLRKLLGRGCLEAAEWIRPEFVKKVGLQQIYEHSVRNPGFRDQSRLFRYQHIFADLHMRGMVWSDRTNSRFGLGFADPWSDLRLVNFALAVPQHVLNRPGEHKRLTRKTMKGIMPEEARRMAQKISPEPLYISAITNKSRETVYSLIRGSQAAARGFIDEEKFLDQYEQFRRNGRGHPQFWWTLTLEMWLRLYWQ